MGRCWKLGDNVTTDEILPSQYMVLTEPRELGCHLFENVNPGFAGRLAAGFNFGCGSSREHAPLALKGAGVAAIVAKSFARIFFRNCVNLGIPAIACPGAVDGINDGDSIEVDFRHGFIKTGGNVYEYEPFPPFLLEYVLNGGLIETLNKQRSHTITRR